MLYILDANICGYIIRNKPEAMKEKLKTVEKNHEIALSSVVVAELLYGTQKKGSVKLSKVVNSFISNFTIYDFDKLAAIQYAIVRDVLQKQGNIIGSNDLLIAAHAKSLDAILVTNNSKEFQRVPDLKIENWI